MFDKLKQILHNRIVSNASWLVAGKVIQMVINLIVGLMTARYLGPSNYGLINYGAAYTGFFSALCTLGINSVIVKEFIDQPGEEGKILGTSLGLRFFSGLFSVITIICVSFVLDTGEPETIAVVALCSIGILFQVFEVFNYWFQSKLQAKKTAIAALIAYSLTAAYKVLLLISGKPVTFFALATSVDYLCVAAVLLFFYRKAHGGKLSFSWAYGKQLLKKSCPYILAGLMVSIYAQTDKLMLKQYLDEAAIGYYATASTTCNMWSFILAAIITSLGPIIVEAHKDNHVRYCQLNRILYAIVFWFSALVSLGFTVFGRWIIQVLYGIAYLPAVAPFKVITWYTAFSYLGVARNTWVVCENKQKYLPPIYVSAALSNVLLNLIFIPLWGTVGAAFASLMAQIVTVLIAPFFIKGMRENSIMMLDAILLKGIVWRKEK